MADSTPPPAEKHVHMADGTKGGNEEGDESAVKAPSARKNTPPRERKRRRQTVLIAVDGSAASNHAVDWYLDEMHKKRQRVVFLHSFELPLMHSYQEMFSSPDLWASTLKHESDRTERMEKTLMRKIKAREIEGKFITRAGGKPGEAILQAAEEEDADMIIMGTRGHGKLMRALLGSVSHYVMSHAHCPVLVFRDKKAKPRSRSGSPKGEGRKGKDKESDTEQTDGDKKGRKEKQKEIKED